MPINTRNKFDPAAQFDATIAEAETHIVAAVASLERLIWLRGKIADDIAAMRDAADELELYTEDEAAELLKITAWHLGCLRRKHNFAVVNLGNKIRYTKEQIAGVCDFFSINNKKPAALKAA